ncbi:MAG: hypothetical protein KDE45_25345, partial [Caldilineaceae bacterium]|nr:hypothetical protein [Caldilinea sp.]MCB0060401.1 hypothetical protein [Caldilineaceae bacterium]
MGDKKRSHEDAKRTKGHKEKPEDQAVAIFVLLRAPSRPSSLRGYSSFFFVPLRAHRAFAATLSSLCP